MMFNATFNNISATLYILVVSFLGGRSRRKLPTSRVTDKLSHNVVYEYTSPERGSNSQR